MTPERWAQIEGLFHRAAESDPQRRAAILDQACRNDAELREQVEALLSSDESARNKMQAVVRGEFEAAAFSLSGSTISHYHILSGLGVGGMGLVYRAQDIKLGRRVAIKFLPEDSAKDPAALRRFEREARSASALEHPSICPIYEFGEHNGQPFIVMPLLEGQTIDALVREQLLPATQEQVQKLLDISIQVVKGLESAHDHGIIHRDIKPSNIFVTTDGQAKILDFGIAKLAHAELEEHNDPDGLGLTETATTVNFDNLTLSRTGAVVGTVAYMSPEQVRGEKVDARTDVFSFGLVLYELATGKRAFGGNTWPVLQEAVLKGIPKPARELNHAIPVKLQSIINKAIEKDCEARFQTAKEMRAELETLQRQLAPRHLPRAWATALIVAGLAFVGILIFMLSRPPKTISVAPEIKLRQLTTNSSENPVSGGAISPDGKYLAFSDTKGLHLKLLATGETRTISQPEKPDHQGVTWEIGAWLPDSSRLLVNTHPSVQDWNEWSSADATIWMISVIGGAPIKLRDHAVLGSVSPDGSTISYATNKGRRGEREFWLMDSSGAEPRQLFAVHDDNALCCLGWSPDGKRYAYILTDASGDAVLSRDLNWGPPVTILHSFELEKMNDLVWLHDSRLIYSLRESGNANVCNYWTMRLNLATGKHIEEPRRLTNWPSYCVSSGSATQDDKTIAFDAWSSFYTSYVADLESGGTRVSNINHFTLEDSDDLIMDWTADNRAVIVAQNRGDHYSLYKQRVDSDTSEPIVSAVAGGIVDFAVLTPDGKWIIALIWPVVGGVMLERPPVPLPLVRIPLGGGPPETLLQLSRPSPVPCARPPSSTCVIVEQSENRKQMIVSTLDPVHGRGAELARFDLARDVDVFVDNLICALSPDGTRLAIARSPESPIEIYSLGGKFIEKIPTKPLGRLGEVVWDAKQKGVFLNRRVEGGTEMLHLDLKGHLLPIRKCTGWACFAFPSPDGRRLAFIENKQSKNMWMMENF